MKITVVYLHPSTSRLTREEPSEMKDGKPDNQQQYRDQYSARV